MIPYSLSGIQFMAHDTECGAFHVFNPDRPEATDRTAYGMVEEMRAFIRLTEGMGHFLDVGALFGVFSMIFTRHPDAIAYALEPSPWAWPLLVEHVNANRSHRIIPFQRFAGNTTGETVPCSRDWKHVCANTPPHPHGEMTTCTTMRIDDMPEIERVDCVKIDVEAYECAVLRGAKSLIDRWRPLIFLECHLKTLAFNGETTASLGQIIKDYQYHIENFDGTRCESLDSSYGGVETLGAFTRVICRPL